MYINSAGNVGIGTSSPATRLQVNSPTAVNTYAKMSHSGAVDGLDVGVNAAGDGIIFLRENSPLRFATNDTEAMRIDSTGNVSIGASSPATKLVLAGNNNALVENNTLRFWDTDTATEANQQIGKIEFFSSDASTPGASVKAYIGAFATDTTPDAYLAFATATTIGSVTERMRIDNVGNLLVGLTSATGVAKLQVSGPIQTTGYTVATLPAGTVGMRTYVTDALAPSFGVTVSGGGAVTIPVFYDGANWIVA
jgi:hypothetical protein